jgi:hypothetical protein
VRGGHSLVWVEDEQKFLVFGGRELADSDPNAVSMNDLWEINLSTQKIEKIDAKGTLPPVRETHAAALTADGKFMIIYGGVDWIGGYKSDVWKYELA